VPDIDRFLLDEIFVIWFCKRIPSSFIFCHEPLPDLFNAVCLMKENVLLLPEIADTDIFRLNRFRTAHFPFPEDKPSLIEQNFSIIVSSTCNRLVKNVPVISRNRCWCQKIPVMSCCIDKSYCTVKFRHIPVNYPVGIPDVGNVIADWSGRWEPVSVSAFSEPCEKLGPCCNVVGEKIESQA